LFVGLFVVFLVGGGGGWLGVLWGFRGLSGGGV